MVAVVAALVVLAALPANSATNRRYFQHILTAFQSAQAGDEPCAALSLALRMC